MTDLKDERMALEKKSKFDSNRHNFAAADQTVELAAEDAAAEEASEDGQPKAKAKGKKRKKANKKKKKNATNADEDLTSADKHEESQKELPVQEERKFEETQVPEWKRELESVLKQKEVDSDDEPMNSQPAQHIGVPVGVTEGNDDEYFDDHWFERGRGDNTDTDNAGAADCHVEHPLDPADMPLVKAPDVVDTDDIHIEIIDDVTETKSSLMMPIVSVEKCKLNYKARKDQKEKQEQPEAEVEEIDDVTDEIETITKEEDEVEEA